MVDPNEFVKAMEYHWTKRLGNQSSEALRELWFKMAHIFGYYAVGKAHRDEWIVLQPPTGSGKTQGTIVYCSMLAIAAKDFYPGVLIVTRLKADADHIASKINELSENMSEADKLNISVLIENAGQLANSDNERSGSMGEAVAYHGDTKDKVDISDLKNYPVLVITHRAYEMALDMLGQDGNTQQTWPHLYNWKGKNRRLVIIDEVLDIVEHSTAELKALRQTEATLSQSIRDRFPEQVECLNEVIDVLDTYEKKTRKKTIKEHKIPEDLIKNKKVLSFTGLRQAMRKETKYDELLGKTDNLERQRLREIHDLVIRDLDNIIKSWAYYAHVNHQPALHTARLLVPDFVQGAVVLDATANRNVLYELFPPTKVEPIPQGSRNYQKVTLHISKGHNLGNGYMKDNAKELCRELIGELNEKLEKNRKVFICTHKDIEPVLESYDPKFSLKVGHWGAIDGSNSYRNCDTAVIFGLPFRPNIWSANVFMALQGEQTTEWLQETSKRTWGKHEDIRRSLNNGQIITNTIQAINRVRCRKVIDAEGNCPSTDIYLMLPSGGKAGEILEGIKKEMPGIKTKDWDFSSAKRKVKRSNYESALSKYIVNMGTGSLTMSEVKKALGMSKATCERLTSKMKDENSDLHKAMFKVGASYKSKGPGKRAYIIKDSLEA
jgi:hypothetical protein